MKIFISSLFLLFSLGLLNQEVVFHHPIQEDDEIASSFGPRTHLNSGEQRFHSGIDYLIPVGTKVFASAEGIIKFVGTKGFYGNIIIIEHPNSYQTYYCNLSKPLEGLSSGQKIKASELIGYSGKSGKVITAGFHFEIRKDGEPIDPAEFLQE